MTHPSDLEDPQAIFRNMCKTERWDLQLGFCAISAAESSTLSISELMSALTKLSKQIYIPAQADPFEQTARLSYVLFEKEGFEGNTEDYNAPHNSLLAYTLQHKKGLPITLSVITLCVAKMLNISLEGVNAPGHFLLRKPDAKPAFFIDPFHKGKIIRHDAFKALLEERHGKMDFEAFTQATKTPSTKDILLRINNNLLIAYQRSENLYGVIRTLERLSYLAPSDAHIVRILAQLQTKAGQYDESIKSYEHYIEHFPEADDIDDVLRELALLKGIN